MTTPPSDEQPAYVDPVTGQPLFIDPVTGQFVFTDPTAAAPPPPTYQPMPPYPSAAPTYPGYEPPAGFPPVDPASANAPMSGYTAPAYPPTAYGYPGYGYPVQALQRQTNGMATTSMILSIVGLPLLFCYGIVGLLLGAAGAILGHIARKQTIQRGQDGGGMALAGIIIGWIVVALGIIIVIFLVWVFTHFGDSDPNVA